MTVAELQAVLAEMDPAWPVVVFDEARGDLDLGYGAVESVRKVLGDGDRYLVELRGDGMVAQAFRAGFAAGYDHACSWTPDDDDGEESADADDAVDG